MDLGITRRITEFVFDNVRFFMVCKSLNLGACSKVLRIL